MNKQFIYKTKYISFFTISAILVVFMKIGHTAPAPVAEGEIGDAHAPVSIVLYTSPTCPQCREFHKNVFSVLKTKYVDTGKAKLSLQLYPLIKGLQQGLSAWY